MNIDLLEEWVSAMLGRSLHATRPVWLSGWETLAALWPLNERFHANIHQIRALPYESRHEAEADKAIKALAFRLPGSNWNGLSAGAWRVLLERQHQALVGASLNEAQGREVMPVPAGLTPTDQTAVVAWLLLYRMRLPFPVDDRSDFELPAGSQPVSFQRH